MNVFENIEKKVVKIKVDNTVHENCHFKQFMHGGKTMMFFSMGTRLNVTIPTKQFIEQMEAPETTV